VVDKDLSVKVWSARAEDLWGLRPYETLGRNFLNLDIGLPLDGLGNTLRTCLAATDPEVSFEKISDATDRRGKAIRCKITCTPLFEEEPVRVTGVTLIMERTDGVA
jgi:two-component system CheB/CheR fusion protein